MNNLLYLLKSYAAERPGISITNVTQLCENSGMLYPFSEDRMFRAYGNDAGFTNSLYEEYVFLRPGVTNRFIEGQVVFLNSRPFPDRNSKYGRMAIARTFGTDGSNYRAEWMQEQIVQQIFRKAGVRIPEPPFMSPSPPAPPETEYRLPLFSRIRSAVVEFLRLQGLSGEVAWTIWWILVNLPLVALVLISLRMWRQRRD